ncbi:MAG: MBL fold metallo-hydrolase [Bacillota bacterium]
MQLTVLVDNKAVVGYGEWGFSALLEVEGLRVLFDAGETDLFRRNAARMGVDLNDLDYLVFSHGHHDHMGGLPHLVAHYITHPELCRPRVVAHPEAFLPRKKEKDVETGTVLCLADLERRFPLSLSREPQWLSERVLWLGQIDRQNDFESPEKPGKILRDGEWETDWLIDDSALAITTDQGLVVLTGCSHSGVCNIIEQARRLTGEQRVRDVVGGSHLVEPSEQRMAATLEYFRLLAPDAVHLGHCTSLNAKIQLAQVAPVKDLFAGLKIEY